MPDAAQAVNRFPLNLSWRPASTPVLTPSLIFRHLINGSLALISLILTWHGLLPCLFLNAHHHGFWPQQLEVVWSLLLQAGSEGPALIFCAVTHTLYKKRARGALAGIAGLAKCYISWRYPKNWDRSDSCDHHNKSQAYLSVWSWQICKVSWIKNIPCLSILIKVVCFISL